MTYCKLLNLIFQWSIYKRENVYGIKKSNLKLKLTLSPPQDYGGVIRKLSCNAIVTIVLLTFKPRQPILPLKPTWQNVGEFFQCLFFKNDLSQPYPHQLNSLKSKCWIYFLQHICNNGGVIINIVSQQIRTCSKSFVSCFAFSTYPPQTYYIIIGSRIDLFLTRFETKYRSSSGPMLLPSKSSLSKVSVSFK